MSNGRNILIIAMGDKEWIGGLYYIKNILYTLFKEKKLINIKTIYILTNKENFKLFDSLLVNENIVLLEYKYKLIDKIFNKITKDTIKRQFNFQILKIVFSYNIEKIYPINGYPYIGIKNRCIFWIPDFQHLQLPEMFQKSEIELRNKQFKFISRQKNMLILSSKDSFDDYKKFFPKYKNEVKIMRFESCIEEEKELLDDDYCKKVVEEFNIPKDFIFLPNQFWKHKNHITVFKAINILVNEKKLNILLICTGNTKDYRNKEHLKKLIDYIENNNLSNNIKILGFIDRVKQLALMKSASFVVQPSLFEGWGTVVEDAKSLDKQIIMSDINVHFEQKTDKCKIFERENYVQLADIINDVLNN